MSNLYFEVHFEPYYLCSDLLKKNQKSSLEEILRSDMTGLKLTFKGGFFVMHYNTH